MSILHTEDEIEDLTITTSLTPDGARERLLRVLEPLGYLALPPFRREAYWFAGTIQDNHFTVQLVRPYERSRYALNIVGTIRGKNNGSMITVTIRDPGYRFAGLFRLLIIIGITSFFVYLLYAAFSGQIPLAYGIFPSVTAGFLFAIVAYIGPSKNGDIVKAKSLLKEVFLADDFVQPVNGR